MGAVVDRARSRIRHADVRSLDRRVLVGAGAAMLTTALVAGVALVVPGETAAKAKPAAAQTRERPPNYQLPIGLLIGNGTVPAPTLAGDHGTVGVPPGTAAAPTRPDTRAVGPRSRTIAAYQGASGTMTPAGIATLAIEKGCTPTQAVTATAIAMAESGGSPSAQGDIALMDATWDWSSGLWQIRGLRAERHTGGLRDSVANQEAATNASAMATISHRCTDWSPWSTFTNGAYTSYLTLATPAARYVVTYYNAHGHHFPVVHAPNPNASIPSQSSDPGHVVGAPTSTGSSTAGPSATRTHAPAKPVRQTKPTAGSSASSSSSSRSDGGFGSGGSSGSDRGSGGSGSSGSGGSHPTSGASSSSTPHPIKSIVSGVGSILPSVTSVLPVPLPSVTLPGLPGH